jgi:hypothetical protein
LRKYLSSNVYIKFMQTTAGHHIIILLQYSQLQRFWMKYSGE